MHKSSIDIELIQFLLACKQSAIIDQLEANITPYLEQLQNYQKLPPKTFHYRQTPPSSFTPTEPHLISPSSEATRLGKEAIKNQKVHAICLAGGVGSRLNFKRPKALFPIREGVTLLDYFISKLPPGLTFTMMCSSMGVELINEALPSHFPKPLIQSNLPYLNQKFKWILTPNGILEGPSGNGSLLNLLETTHYLKELKEAGVESLIIFPIDNPLITPYDPQLIGAHLLNNNEVTVKGFQKGPQDLKVGSFAQNGDQTVIIDYHHPLPNKLKYGNTNHFCLSIEWLENHLTSLPIHWVPKTAQGVQVFKGERFITDLLSKANKASIFPSERAQCFHPLKSQDDLKSLILN